MKMTFEEIEKAIKRTEKRIAELSHQKIKMIKLGDYDMYMVYKSRIATELDLWMFLKNEMDNEK